MTADRELEIALAAYDKQTESHKNIWHHGRSGAVVGP